MRPSSSWSPLLGPFWLLTLGAAASGQVVQWNIEKRHVSPGLDRRAHSTFEEVITNEKGRGGYFSTVSIGTPGQNLTLQLDTASSDIWVPWSKAMVCAGTSSSSGSCTLGSFDPDKSDTFENVGTGLFDITYVDDNTAKGDYVEDRFEIGGAVVSNLTMGLARRTTIPYGLVGVGYALNEASTETADTIYPNLPVAMHEEGSINTIAYSLWLNDLDANTGNILFGGVDTGKYVGNMARIKVLPDEKNDNFTHFTVAMTSLEATSPTGSDTLTSDEFPISAVLDCGTTLSYVPQDLAEQIWEEVGAAYHSKFGMAVLPCSHAHHPGHFTFGFAGPDGPRINITMDELVVDLTNGRQPQFDSGPYDGELVCEFGIQNYSESPYLLGDTFLRSAYVVYDLVNNEIGLAATDFNSTETNIVPFASKGAEIPSATVAPNQSEATQKPENAEHDFKAAPGFQDEKKDDDDDDSVGSALEVPGTLWLVTGVSIASWLIGACDVSISI